MAIPIRISVRIDFADGSEHEYEVRGPAAVDAPDLSSHWVPPVMTAGAAERLVLEQQQREEMASLRADLDQLLAVATLYLESFGDCDLMSLPEKLSLQGVEDVVARRGKRY